MTKKICNGVYYVDAPTVETCTKYGARLSKRAHIERFHNCHAFVGTDYECCERSFISYWTHICTHFWNDCEIDFYVDPYDYSTTTTKQVNRFLRDNVPNADRLISFLRKLHNDGAFDCDTLAIGYCYDDDWNTDNLVGLYAERYDEDGQAIGCVVYDW